MDDETKLRRDASRAAQAEQLLENEIFKGAFEALEAEYYLAWRNTGVNKLGQYNREKLWLAINILGKVKEHVGKIVSNGKLAKAELALRETKPKAA